ncbi:pili assembly chaperone [Idiomarina sp. MD25a]|uniref:prepilin-type N-terminal cleavage/methylation domain-containing protein n=1 Tax=Idiomarina sp. MD25a TaxID=1889913 RepID=UPI0008F8CC3C|nr:prepilin-type N-terminal cleavage/methylation domain-containing protein [Idiomarina sp. MD25a]OIM99257.1 pili assembly chaperone [Idiomarina sp. MD25a]
MDKRQQGFTIIELIIVVVILGLLAASALPRFTDVTADAEDSAIEGVAGGFASAVGIVRGEWELRGRPKGGTDGAGAELQMDGVPVYVDGDTGYPVSGNNDTATDVTLSNEDCRTVMTAILQGSPTVMAEGDGGAIDEYRYYTYATDDPNASAAQGQGTNQVCVYYLVNTIKGISPLPSGNDYQTTGNSFVYNPRNGGVNVFSNNN